MSNTYTTNITESNFYDRSAVIRNENHVTLSDKDAEILQELQRVREQLETTEPMIADALASLEEAVKAQDKPTTKKLLGKFAGGTTKAVLAGVASKALLSWMGIA